MTSIEDIRRGTVSCNNRNECKIDNWNSLFVYQNRCQNGWIKLQRIGQESTVGEIWLSKCDDGLKNTERYIMKIIKYGQETHQGLTCEEDLLKEVVFQQQASEHGLAPPVYEILMREDRGMIIMKIAGKLELMKAIMNTAKDREMSLEQKINKIEKYLADGIQLVRNLHKIGILHGDPHLNNIMLDNEGNMLLIDFGLSKHIGNEDPNKDFFQLINQLNYIADNDQNIDPQILNVFRNFADQLYSSIKPVKREMSLEEIKERYINIRESINSILDDGENWDVSLYKDLIDIGPDILNTGREKFIEQYQNLRKKVENYMKENNIEYKFKSKHTKKSKKSPKKTLKKSVKKTKAKKSVKKSAKKTKKTMKKSLRR